MKSNENLKILGRYEGNLFGGKIDNLNILVKKGFNIPKGFCLNKIILKKDLNNYFNRYINSQMYIARSSANCEDGNKLSYAGLFDSIEGFYNKGFLYDDIRKVFKSLNNKNIDFYEEQVLGNKISNKQMNILVQEYIVGDFSGVYMSNIFNERVLGFIKGNNKLLVNGKINGTNIYMDKKFRILKQEYFLQKVYLNNNLKVIEYNKKVYLEKKIILQLIREFIKIEKIFAYDVDIEWTIKNNIIYILQVRPITI